MEHLRDFTFERSGHGPRGPPRHSRQAVQAEADKPKHARRPPAKSADRKTGSCKLTFLYPHGEPDAFPRRPIKLERLAENDSRLPVDPTRPPNFRLPFFSQDVTR